MIGLLFLPLCVLFAGEYNCEYQWTQVQDRETFESIYLGYGGNLESSNVGAFRVFSEKKVFFYNTDYETILHEIDHIYCDLKYRDEIDKSGLLACNVMIDTYDRIIKSRASVDPTPEPPKISLKMEYASRSEW